METAITVSPGGTVYVPSVTPKDLKNVVCPNCEQPFKLTWSNYFRSPGTLVIRLDTEEGVRDVRICCPHCSYEETL